MYYDVNQPFETVYTLRDAAGRPQVATDGLQVKMTIVSGGETAVVGCSPVNADTGKGSCAPPLAFLFASLWQGGHREQAPNRS